MKMLKVLLVALAAIAICGPVRTILADTPTLSASEAASLSWLREFSKYKWDIYRGSGSESGPVPEEPILLALATDERHRMDTYRQLLDHYGLEDPVVSYELWVFSDSFLTEDLNNRMFVGWLTRPGQFKNCAYMEELSIQELRRAIAGTQETLLSEAYTEMLEDSYANLVVLASWFDADLTQYSAQLLEQADVDQILSGMAPPAIGDDFVINTGLNDAWFDPVTSGQGFFISVYPQSRMMILSWLTFDSEAPVQTNAHLGDPCQRWFAAQGHYLGAVADLVVYSASGGIFDQSEPVPVLREIGSISLEFENCNSAVLTYDLPGIPASGMIPLQRVGLDNVALCETLAYTAAH